MLVVQMSPRSALLFIAVYSDKALFRAELDTMRVAGLSTFQDLPAVKKLGSNMQGTERVPDQVRCKVLAFVIGGFGLKFSILHLGESIDPRWWCSRCRIGSHTGQPSNQP